MNTDNKRPTSRDVAALAQVAQSTVSYVLSGQRKVSKSTERRVREAMEILGYQPHAGARNLRTSKTKVIALALRLDERVDAVETAPYIRSVIVNARKYGYDVVLSPIAEGPEDLVRLASRSICDGIIMMDITVSDPRVEIAAKLPVPTILVGRPDDNCGLDVVDFNTRAVGEAIVRELEATGHRRIMVVGEEKNHYRHYRFILEFHDGLRKAAAERGIELKILQRENSRWDGFIRIADTLLDDLDRCAIVTRTPQLTDWVVRYLESKNIVPGRDVTLTAYCPDEIAVSYHLPVSNVSADIDKLCEAAVERLVFKIDNRCAGGEICLISPERLQRRATTCLICE